MDKDWQHLEKMRRDFVANVSHELRTPLTIIRGYIELLLDSNSMDPVNLKDIHMQIFQQSLRMEQLIEDLLLLSRLENEEQHASFTEQVDVRQLLQNLKQEALILSGEKKQIITLRVDKSAFLLGNADELRSLFSNIIINAVKYTPTHGRITISFKQVKKCWVFSVKDTGIGVEEKHISRLTERFYRVDKGRSRSSGGTGLGLAIAKHVLLRHEATLSIKSQLGLGSTFTCTFPPNRSLS